MSREDRLQTRGCGESGLDLSRPARAVRPVAWKYLAGLLIVAPCAGPAKSQDVSAHSGGAPHASVAAPAGARSGAHAPKIYHLLGFNLSGSKRVDLKAVVAKLPQHAGDLITSDEIKADADRVSAELKALHVHGTLTTGLLERDGKGHYIWVIWDIQKQDAMSYLPLRASRHFGSQSFSGNVRLSGDQLAAATGFHPGDAMPDGSISDARTGIEQAYEKVAPGLSVEVKGAVKLKKDDSVAIAWKISEPG